MNEIDEKNKGKKVNKKLGNSTNVTIGKKSYSSDNFQLQNKQVNTVKGTENQPRNVAQKNVDNQANKVKTDIRNISSKPLNGTKTQINADKIIKSTVKKEQYQGNIQRQTSIRVQPQTIINSKKPVAGQVNKPNSVKNGIVASSIKVESKKDVPKQNNVGVNVGVGVKTTPTPVNKTINKNLSESSKPLNTTKTQINASKVATATSQNSQYQSNIQRQTAIRVQPQTVISNKQPIVGNIKKPNSVKSGIVASSVKVENTNVKNTNVSVKNAPIQNKNIVQSSKPLNTAKTQINANRITTATLQNSQYQSNIQRQTAIRVQPQNIISNKQPIVGHIKRPNAVKSGIVASSVKVENTNVKNNINVNVKNIPIQNRNIMQSSRPLNSAKVQINPNRVTTSASQNTQYQGNIQRQTAIRVQPRTIISNKSIQQLKSTN
jgi:ferritin-like metal-binding protein YciE